MRPNNNRRSILAFSGILASALWVAGCDSEQTQMSATASATSSSVQAAKIKSPHDSRLLTEKLNRGAIGVPSEKGVLISWRKLNDDQDDLSFEIYRDNVKITQTPIKGKSNFLDAEGTPESVYSLVSNKGETLEVKPWQKSYHEIPLQIPAGGASRDGTQYTYNANDASVADLDGDGELEIVLKWDPSNSKDNAFAGYTGPTLLDGYKLDGTHLWRINLGPNIRSGAHYTQFMVFDFDGDGKAEIAVKTADGSVDGKGNVIGDANADWVSHEGEVEIRDRTGAIQLDDGRLIGRLQGRIIKGPEYFSVFEGATGKVLDTVPYIPQRAPGNDNPTPEEMKAIWDDNYANRSDRFLAGVGYLDGKSPSIIMARGYYARSVVAAYQFIGGKISTQWVFDSKADGVPASFSGQGNHQLSIADIDGDGKDEIIYGAMAIDHDGSPKWSTDLKHGDAMHVSDFDPTREGLESFHVYESVRANGGVGSSLVSVNDGTVIWKKSAEKDTGRGLAADIDPNHLGAETWALNSPQLFNVKGEAISDKRPPQVNFAVWWDGDLLRELLDSTKIFKWNWQTATSEVIFSADNVSTNNGTKNNPAISGDILGDWREEIIFRTSDNSALRIYSTPIPTEYGLVTLLQDRQYRLALTWQNTAYNQPPHPSFYLGEGMSGVAKE